MPFPTNVEKLAEATGAEPHIALGDSSSTITLRVHGAVYTATAATPADAARKLLDALGIDA